MYCEFMLCFPCLYIMRTCDICCKTYICCVWDEKDVKSIHPTNEE